MTTVPQFTENVVTALNYLDTVLPAGSHVLFIGIVDGRILWDNLHNK
jgi:acyloxyacyl hydrolase